MCCLLALLLEVPFLLVANISFVDRISSLRTIVISPLRLILQIFSRAERVNSRPLPPSLTYHHPYPLGLFWRSSSAVFCSTLPTNFLTRWFMRYCFSIAVISMSDDTLFLAFNYEYNSFPTPQYKSRFYTFGVNPLVSWGSSCQNVVFSFHPPVVFFCRTLIL